MECGKCGGPLVPGVPGDVYCPNCIRDEIKQALLSPLVERTSTPLIEGALIEVYGERCSTFDPNCDACKAWKELDKLKL